MNELRSPSAISYCCGLQAAIFILILVASIQTSFMFKKLERWELIQPKSEKSFTPGGCALDSDNFLHNTAGNNTLWLNKFKLVTEVERGREEKKASSQPYLHLSTIWVWGWEWLLWHRQKQTKTDVCTKSSCTAPRKCEMFRKRYFCTALSQEEREKITGSTSSLLDVCFDVLF